jgi:hypothetical protein
MQLFDGDLIEIKNLDILPQISRWCSDRRVCFKTQRGYKIVDRGQIIDSQLITSKFFSSSDITIPIIRSIEFVKANFKLIRHQEIPKSFFGKFEDFEIVISVSHKWLLEDNPDPEGKQLSEIKDYIFKEFKDDLIGLFYDYICIPQKPRTINENKDFRCYLEQMNKLYLLSERVMIPVDGKDAYFKSSWCVFECILGYLNRSLINHINEIKDNINLRVLGVAQTKLEAIKCIDTILDTTIATNNDDIIELKNQLVEIITEGALWNYDFKRSKYRKQVILSKELKHSCTFRLDYQTNTIFHNNGKNGFSDDEIQKYSGLIKQEGLCGDQDIKKSAACFCMICCWNCCCYLSPFVGLICAKCFNRDKLNQIYERLKETGLEFNCLDGNTQLTVTMHIMKKHKVIYIINSNVVIGELEQLVNHAYGGLLNFLDHHDSGMIDYEVGDYMIKTSLIKFKISDYLL